MQELSSADIAAHLLQLETELMNPLVRRSSSALTTLLADDFREFGSSGHIFTKAQIVHELQTESLRQISLMDFHCDLPALNLALVTYRTQTQHDRNPPIQTLRSSLWVYRDARWQMLFHQGTRLTTVV